MRKKQLFLTLALIVLVAAGSLLLLKRNSATITKTCPDQWIEDKMPRIEGDDSPRQYFIAGGERRELKDYDVEWVRANCSLQIQEVQ